MFCLIMSSYWYCHVHSNTISVIFFTWTITSIIYVTIPYLYTNYILTIPCTNYIYILTIPYLFLNYTLYVTLSLTGDNVWIFLVFCLTSNLHWLFVKLIYCLKLFMSCSLVGENGNRIVDVFLSSSNNQFGMMLFSCSLQNYLLSLEQSWTSC